MKRRLELLLVTGILLMAAALRAWDLSRLPPGFSDQEFAYIRIAETLRQGDVAVYFEVGDGQGRAGMYGVGGALATELVGGGLLGYRLLPFWIGLVTLALLYAVARRLFGMEVALIALGLMSVNLRANLLSRAATSEAAVPAYVLLTMLVLAAAFHLRREVRFRAPTTLPFAVLAGLLGAAGYLHYTALALVPVSALFFAHLLFTGQPLSRRVWSAVIFVAALATVIGAPYLISTFRNTNLSEPYLLETERPRSLTDAADGALRAVGGVIWQGDARPTENTPKAALVGPVIALLLIAGVAEAGRRWREPGYALLLLALAAGLLTDAWVGVEPTFSANLVALPPIMLLPGIGAVAVARALWARGFERAGRIMALGLVAILVVNGLLVRHRLFGEWKHDRRVEQAYHANLGYLAAYLDRTPDDLPVSLCAVRLNEPGAIGLSPRQMLRLMLHRDTLTMRQSDCRGGIVLINAGAPMRFIFADPDGRMAMPPELQIWLEGGEPIPVEGLPEGAALRIDVEQAVQNAGGQWDALAPAYYMPGENGNTAPVDLPVSLEQNLTFAGYDPRALSVARVPGGDPIVLVTYWRVDGPLPARLGIFAHMLAYAEDNPPTLLLEPWAEANSLDVIPAQLRNRDFFAQVSYIWLSENLTSGTYALTVGAYVDAVSVLDNHLAVLDPALDYQPHGDRLLLGDILVEPLDKPPDTDSKSGDSANGTPGTLLGLPWNGPGRNK